MSASWQSFHSTRQDFTNIQWNCIELTENILKKAMDCYESLNEIMKTNILLEFFPRIVQFHEIENNSWDFHIPFLNSPLLIEILMCFLTFFLSPYTFPCVFNVFSCIFFSIFAYFCDFSLRFFFRPHVYTYCEAQLRVFSTNFALFLHISTKFLNFYAICTWNKASILNLCILRSRDINEIHFRSSELWHCVYSRVQRKIMQNL